jgi:hypothetical protein
MKMQNFVACESESNYITNFSCSRVNLKKPDPSQLVK